MADDESPVILGKLLIFMNSEYVRMFIMRISTFYNDTMLQQHIKALR